MVLGRKCVIQQHDMYAYVYFHCLGQYSSWLGHHQDTLQNCVHLCINALSNPDLIQSASISLKELTMENRSHMSKYLNDIFPIIKVE
jgi:hypothetical protein